jgi:Family of unknown function (DUF6492)
MLINSFSQSVRHMLTSFFGFPADTRQIELLRRFYLAYLRKVKPFLQHRRSRIDETSIDILIPCIPKDLSILPLVIEASRSYITHPISNFFIVGPSDNRIQEICEKHNCTFLEENNVLPICRADINYLVNGEDRSGWIFQQLIKLYSDVICGSRYCLIVDADTVFVKCQGFINKGKFVFNCSDEYHQPYFNAYSKLTGYQPVSPLSFVSHHMIFDRDKLMALRSHIENRTGKKWYESILDVLDATEASSFSEYETYGNFVLKRFRKSVSLEYWFNTVLSRKDFRDGIGELEERFGGSCKSVSFHDYLELD